MCGIVGAYFPKNTKVSVAELLVKAGKAQKHRGKKGSGIGMYASGQKKYSVYYKSSEPMLEVFTRSKVKDLEKKGGTVGAFQGRYPTDGHSSTQENVQPLRYVIGDGETQEEGFIAHNGNLTTRPVRLRPEDSDSWDILYHLCKEDGRKPFVKRLANALQEVDGAYCLVIIRQDAHANTEMFAVRDRYGQHPLVYGEHEDGWVVASEPCSLKAIGIKQVFNVPPGRMLQFNTDGVSEYILAEADLRQCIFEIAYFMRHDTYIFDKNEKIVSIESIRKSWGRRTWEECNKSVKKRIDCIVPIPNSACAQAEGISEASGRPLIHMIIRNRPPAKVDQDEIDYIRTYMEEESKGSRNGWYKMMAAKFSFDEAAIKKAKNIVLVDDSIIRSNTIEYIIWRLHQINPKLYIIVMITYPPVLSSCFSGQAYSSLKELGYHKYGGVKGIKRAIKAQELHYITPTGMLAVAEEVTGFTQDQWCQGCYLGKYPFNKTRMRKEYKDNIFTVA